MIATVCNNICDGATVKEQHCVRMLETAMLARAMPTTAMPAKAKKNWSEVL